MIDSKVTKSDIRPQPVLIINSKIQICNLGVCRTSTVVDGTGFPNQFLLHGAV